MTIGHPIQSLPPPPPLPLVKGTIIKLMLQKGALSVSRDGKKCVVIMSYHKCLGFYVVQSQERVSKLFLIIKLKVQLVINTISIIRHICQN